MEIGLKLQVIEKVLKLLVAFLIFTFIARALGPENFGKLNLVYALIGSIAFLHHFGINELLSKDLTLYSKNGNRLITSALILRFIGACISYLALQIIGVIWVHDEILSIVLLIGSSSLFFQIFDSQQCIYLTQGLGTRLAKYKIAAFLLVSIIKIALVSIEAPYYWYILPFILEPFTLAILLAQGILKAKYYTSFEFSKRICKRYLYRGMPIALSVLVVSLSLRLDQLIIANYLDYSDVGSYGVAVRFIEAWYIIPTVVCSTLMPSLIRLKAHNRSKYKTSLKHLTMLLSMMFITLAACAYFTMEFIILYMFGSEYISSIQVVYILGIGGLVVTHGTIFATWQIIENKQKYRLYFQLSALAINATVSLSLVSSYGSSGVAVGTVTGFIIATYILPLFFRETRIFILNVVFHSLNIKLISSLPYSYAEIKLMTKKDGNR